MTLENANTETGFRGNSGTMKIAMGMQHVIHEALKENNVKVNEQSNKDEEKQK